MKICELAERDFEAASRLLWDTFYACEKYNFSLDGMAKFRDVTSPISLQMNSFDGYIRLYGAFEKGKLCGVGAVREKKHILLLYVAKDRFGGGIGSALLARLERACEPGRISVNSSDGAVGFYEAHGYRKTGIRREEDDFIFTTMEKLR